MTTYNQGGWVPFGGGTATNRTGNAEPVLTAPQAAAVFPITATVTVHPFAGETKDAHRNVVPVYGEPRVEPVYGWAAADDDEELDGRDQTQVPLDLYAPVGFTCQPRDQITVPDVGRFEVVGHPSRYQNPFGWQPGRVIHLRRMEG